MQILVGYEEVGNKSVRSQSRSRSTASFDEFSRDEKSDAGSRSNVRNQVGQGRLANKLSAIAGIITLKWSEIIDLH